MHSNADKLVIALLAFAIGFACCDIFNAKRVEKKVTKPQKEVQYELKRESKSNSTIKDVELNGMSEELVDYEEVDKIFYTNLQNCNSINILANPGHIGYIIEGIVDNKCLFRQRQVGFMDTICNLPMDMTQKYAEEGLNIARQLDELRSQNKSGFVDASQYINDINNDKTYCRHEYYQKK